ncbi:MAG: hypothetical protein JWQ40_308 [Segetibacter sp.]|nr:hypothetical protein [Segetibacter sp.]
MRMIIPKNLDSSGINTCLLQNYSIIYVFVVGRSEFINIDQNTILNADDYFKNIIGVTLPANAAIETIKLKFSASREPYVNTKRLHHSKTLFHEMKMERCL